MKSASETAVRDVWHQTATRSAGALLGPFAHAVRSEHWSDNYAQPGYIGQDYQPGGLLFIAQNPAGGGDQYDVIHEAIREFTRNPESLDRLNAVLYRDMQAWKIYRNAVRWVLDTSGQTFAQVAYINMFKWRTVKNVSSTEWKALYDRCWGDTQDQIAALEPRLIVLLGKGVAHEFEKRYHSLIDWVPITRSIGDTRFVEQSASVEQKLRTFGKEGSA